MAKQYRIPPGTVYPATVVGYRNAKAGKLDEVDWIKPSDEELVISPPYPDIVPSWLANGIEEIGEDEVTPVPEPVKTPRKSNDQVSRGGEK